MIRAGSYDYVNPDITPDHFSIEGEGEKIVTVELVHFNRQMTSDEVEKEFKARGLKLCRIEHLLALGAKYPELQRQFPILALGSVWRYPDGGRYVPELWTHVVERRLDLPWRGPRWGAHYRFAGVRE